MAEESPFVALVLSVAKQILRKPLCVERAAPNGDLRTDMLGSAISNSLRGCESGGDDSW